MPIRWDVKGMKRPNQSTEFTVDMVREMAKCAKDIFYFAQKYYTVIEEKRGKHIIKLFDYQKKMLNDFVESRFNVVCSARQMGKALDINTPILTTHGIKLLKDIKVGDIIYDANGKETTVTFITDIMYDHEVYELSFSNGDTIYADAEHIWQVNIDSWWSTTVNMTTYELIKYIEEKGNKIWISPAKKIDFPKLQQELDPYILGLWIGAGKERECKLFGDYEFISDIKPILESKKSPIHTYKTEFGSQNIFSIFLDNNIKQILQKYDIFDTKLIPDRYIRNSVERREELLSGLLDSCGWMKNGLYHLGIKNNILVRQIRMILSSLGVTCNVINNGEKDDTKTIIFNYNKNLFHINKKYIQEKNTFRNEIRLQSWKQVESRPVRCLQVDNKKHLFLAGESLIPTHNTTCSALYILWYSMFETDKMVGVLANKEKTAKSIIDEIKLAYLEMPDWIKPGIEKWDQLEIKFDNGSSIMAGATSADSFRGESLSLLFLDEFAFITESVAEEFFTSAFPTISQGGRMIIVSTPNGAAGKFYDIFRKAEDMGFRKNLITWNLHPDRDETWRETTFKILGKHKFMREHQCSFTGSSHTLIEGDILAAIKTIDAPWMPEEGYFIWRKPVKDRIYFIGVDVSKGSGRDYTVANIYDVTDFHKDGRYEQVGLFMRNDIVLFDFKVKLLKLCKTWNDAGVIIEDNGLGSVLADSLYNEDEYEYVFYDYDAGTYGINANSKTKPLALTYFKDDIEKRRHIINSEEMIKQLNYFEEAQPGVFRARPGPGFFDDIVASGYWVAYALRSKFYEDFIFTKKNIVLDEYVSPQEDEMSKDEEILDLFENVSRRKQRDDFMNELM